ncbi:DUF1003 domain-containing protein [Arthrobacter sp. MMS18-M83]|uniref:DUF1003 domain-containing protein n=1 Tax=Arthrobacter sp. MMS18-M83 TaxID=2996261 RepID=UPI00227CB8BC|nr:DUF1003 domain-containing protein [Arthrobacter sp. MMS18-M83]WAH99034.1 DUF1003 domain-containing protein [Arthrobacter sp. MMS18-M83]
MSTAEQGSTWHAEHKAALSSGQRAADIMRNGMGSWPFVGGFIFFMLVWAAINTWVLPGNGWDPYPFILLNLFLSMLAGLQGAILLIAAKRQDAIAAAMAQHDYDTDLAARADIGLLLKINEQQLEILHELRRISPDSDSVSVPPTAR